MNVVATPTIYQSAFREALFVQDDVEAQGGMDVEIYETGTGVLAGVKRMYGSGRMSVNVAPYVRGSIVPEPLAGLSMEVYEARERTARCRIVMQGVVSDEAILTAGSCDAPVNGILSAAPERVLLRTGERDEIAFFAGEEVSVGVRVEFTATDGAEYVRDVVAGAFTDSMRVMVVVADEAVSAFELLTGRAAEELAGFAVKLRFATEEGFEVETGRSYVVDSVSKGGRRLAWVNRYGAVDYYTFPVVKKSVVAGSHEGVETSDGYRAVATTEIKTEVLVSEPCDEGTAEWLAELFSSPAVWMMRGGVCTKVKVSKGEAECSAERPAVVSVEVEPMVKSISRKF